MGAKTRETAEYFQSSWERWKFYYLSVFRCFEPIKRSYIYDDHKKKNLVTPRNTLVYKNEQ